MTTVFLVKANWLQNQMKITYSHESHNKNLLWCGITIQSIIFKSASINNNALSKSMRNLGIDVPQHVFIKIMPRFLESNLRCIQIGLGQEQNFSLQNGQMEKSIVLISVEDGGHPCVANKVRHLRL